MKRTIDKEGFSTIVQIGMEFFQRLFVPWTFIEKGAADTIDRIAYDEEEVGGIVVAIVGVGVKHAGGALGEKSWKRLGLVCAMKGEAEGTSDYFGGIVDDELFKLMKN